MCIRDRSRTGQIGEIYEIQNLIIALPLEDNTFKRSKSIKEQYWEVFEKRKELKNIKTIFDWKIYRDDLIQSVENFVESKGEPIILSGHSMGGASVMQVAAKRPDLVSGIVLVEPVLISKMNLNILKIAKKFPITKSIPFIKEMTSRSDSTLKRRVEFPNKEMILKSYRGRGAFATWEEGFLKDYVDGGTREFKNKIKLWKLQINLEDFQSKT